MKAKNLSMVILAIILITSSCESFLAVDPPTTAIPTKLAFTDDRSATAAISGIYNDLYLGTGFAGGSPQAIVSLAGLSADEMHFKPINLPELIEFENNALTTGNNSLLTLWTKIYKVVYQVNAFLEGMRTSSGVTKSLHDQLIGEALFIRAFCNFYLVNFFGDVPLVLTTDYRANAEVSRSTVEIVYSQIEADLRQAEDLLSENYPTSGRVRVNKYSATALLSRMYLFREDWPRAEDKANNVISKTTLYNLNPDLNSIFKRSSNEAILQFWTLNGTFEGTTFSQEANNHFVLNDNVVKAFQVNDKRKIAWVKTIVADKDTTYFLSKYRFSSPEIQVDEYSMVLRLSELYLIRAEARLRQNKKSLAISDVDVIRSRAGLPLIQNISPDIGEDDLMAVITQERRSEFLLEWGHRWLDLKRLKIANVVLSYKPGWTLNDQLYPIPEAELRINPRLEPQNKGY